MLQSQINTSTCHLQAGLLPPASLPTSPTPSLPFAVFHLPHTHTSAHLASIFSLLLPTTIITPSNSTSPPSPLPPFTCDAFLTFLLVRQSFLHGRNGLWASVTPRHHRLPFFFFVSLSISGHQEQIMCLLIVLHLPRS